MRARLACRIAALGALDVLESVRSPRAVEAMFSCTDCTMRKLHFRRLAITPTTAFPKGRWCGELDVYVSQEARQGSTSWLSLYCVQADHCTLRACTRLLVPRVQAYIKRSEGLDQCTSDSCPCHGRQRCSALMRERLYHWYHQGGREPNVSSLSLYWPSLGCELSLRATAMPSR